MEHRRFAKFCKRSQDRKGPCSMINIRTLAMVAVVAGSILCATAQAQNALSAPAAQTGIAPVAITQPTSNTGTTSPSTLQRMPRPSSRVAPQGKPISVEDLLSGITLSDQQKPRIEQVRKDMSARMDRVAHDLNENQDQKAAMLQGLHHMELREVYLLLTPEQRIEARKKAEAQRAAEQPPQSLQPGTRPN